MKVLLVFSSSQIGGAERSLTRMALMPSKIEYRLATLGSAGPWSEWALSVGGKPLTFGDAGKGNFHAYWRLYRFLRKESVDIIYVCGIRASLFLRLFRWLVPNIKLVHGVRWNPDSNSRLDRFFRFVERFLHGLVDGWITNSTIAKQTLIRRCNIPEERIAVIYNGIDPPAEMPPALTERPLEILTVANLNPRKGYLEYLQVIKKVIAEIPRARFVFVGRDDMHGKVQQAITKEGLDKYVHYAGFQPDVTQWYRRARVFVLPSLWGEGCPTTILEAMSFGIPVVAYKVDGISELVSHGVDGFVPTENDVESFLNHVCLLLGNEDIGEKLGGSGRNKVVKGFTIESSTSQHELALRNFCCRTSKTGC